MWFWEPVKNSYNLKISQSEQFASKNTYLGALVCLGINLCKLQTWLQVWWYLAQQAEKYMTGRNGKKHPTTPKQKTPSQSHHKIWAEWENTIFPKPRILQDSEIKTLGEKNVVLQELGRGGFGWLFFFFINLAKKSGLFISCEIQTMLSTILRKWIDVKWYFRIRPVAKLLHHYRKISRKSFL